MLSARCGNTKKGETKQSRFYLLLFILPKWHHVCQPSMHWFNMRQESLSDQVSLYVRGCCLLAEKSADSGPQKLQLTNPLKERLRSFSAPQDTVDLPACQGLFSTQISCPPARRADTLAPDVCSSLQSCL